MHLSSIRVDVPMHFKPLGEDDEPPIHWFAFEATRQIHQALSVVLDDALWSPFDAGEMEPLEICPGIWHEAAGDLKQENSSWFGGLKHVVAPTVQSGQGLLVALG